MAWANQKSKGRKGKVVRRIDFRNWYPKDYDNFRDNWGIDYIDDTILHYTNYNAPFKSEMAAKSALLKILKEQRDKLEYFHFVDRIEILEIGKKKKRITNEEFIVMKKIMLDEAGMKREPKSLKSGIYIVKDFKESTYKDAQFILNPYTGGRDVEPLFFNGKIVKRLNKNYETSQFGGDPMSFGKVPAGTLVIGLDND